jgi:hypothetical protein
MPANEELSQHMRYDRYLKVYLPSAKIKYCSRETLELLFKRNGEKHFPTGSA